MDERTHACQHRAAPGLYGVCDALINEGGGVLDDEMVLDAMAVFPEVNCWFPGVNVITRQPGCLPSCTCVMKRPFSAAAVHPLRCESLLEPVVLCHQGGSARASRKCRKHLNWRAAGQLPAVQRPSWRRATAAAYADQRAGVGLGAAAKASSCCQRHAVSGGGHQHADDAGGHPETAPERGRG